MPRITWLMILHLLYEGWSREERLLFDRDQPHISNSLAQQLELVLFPTSYHHHVTGNSVISQDPMASESRSHTAGDSPDGLSTSPRGARKQRIRRKVSRTRAGCMTCKSRRKRCDMTRPCCGDCTRLNLVGVTYYHSGVRPHSTHSFFRNANGLR